ncbi:hypothetical protein BDN72DRAFT_905270 [Pluteus cervinus]|uniref:Uncharacterized protein n=1 Tax=Pluteus cervinus TaxID=181527 RepID=A0ACD3A343_9AGAR|nr:hypothetical protein BDN72DRAFT_905270 [Pluteus cervinus]
MNATNNPATTSIPDMLSSLLATLTTTEDSLGESMSDLDGIVLMVSSTHTELERVQETIIDIRTRVEHAIAQYTSLDDRTMALWAQAAELIHHYSVLRIAGHGINAQPHVLPPPPPPPPSNPATAIAVSDTEDTEDDEAGRVLPSPSDDELEFPSASDREREDSPENPGISAHRKRTLSSVETLAGPAKKTKLQVAIHRPNWPGQASTAKGASNAAVVRTQDSSAENAAGARTQGSITEKA